MPRLLAALIALTTALGTAVVAVNASASPPAKPAADTEICESVSVTVLTLTPIVVALPQCIAWPQVFCEMGGTGLPPTFEVAYDVCVPTALQKG